MANLSSENRDAAHLVALLASIPTTCEGIRSRNLAEIFAAQPNSLLRLSKREQEVLRTAYEPVARRLRKLCGIPPSRPGERVPRWLVRQMQRAMLDDLAELHRLARPVVCRLINGEDVNFALDHLPAMTLRLKGSAVNRKIFPAHPPRMLLGQFLELLLLKPFPFRRCLQCQRVFVRKGRRIYCSPSCSTRGSEAARKEERREYMRQYMAKRRAKRARQLLRGR